MSQDLKYWDLEAEAFNLQYETFPRFVEREVVWKQALEQASSEIDNGLIAADVGCGPGRLAQMLVELGRNTVCIDQSEAMLKLARSRIESLDLNCEVQFRQAALPFDARDLAGAVGIVACSSVLEYVEDPPAAVKSLASLLSADGIMLVSLPSMRSRFRRYERILRWIPLLRPSYLVRQIWRPSIESATAVFQQAGLTVSSLDYYGAPPYPAIFGKPGNGAETLVLFTLKRAS